MKCREIMNLDPEWIASSATVLEAAQVMRDRSASFLLIFDASPSRLRGVVTDRDMAVRVCADNRVPESTPLMDVATTAIATCVDDDEVQVASQKMGEAERSHLVVIDKDQEVVGVLSLADVLGQGSSGRAGKTARAVLAGEARGRQTPPERIKLTPSTAADEDKVAHQPSVMMGASRSSSMRVFP
jgi:CBS domain-containing protein